ncbi:DNA methyltransferase [Entomospira culicis]|uniref:Methyltransferase n=1 Tax=Entomospira culicis TaxID=2719989 RepID=A0A968GH68_9SPIO|nr:DNA methyltransferase [Entomospira culicis]NIZ19329.1 hypothetical protein [Entomospira culicis]NIZ69766.1 hypothetical protein [Entomospira culicis]WDI36877.1 DNA methyltransferase [Entomospira culicis]WDI38506.1 DNA methyltransferase [Entomospira culicis]
MAITNTLYTNDNLFVLTGLNSELVDLIYLDPPFNSKRIYSAPVGSKAAGSSFKDMWTWQDVNEAYLESLIDKYPALVRFIMQIQQVHSKGMMAYITYMTQRLIEMHRVLKPTGSLYLHCDPTASHYLKVVLDAIFGKENFRNEIVWCYSTATTPYIKQFPRNTDIIYWYSKSKIWTFNKDKIRVPYKGGAPHGGTKWLKEGETLEEWREQQGNLGKIPFSWWADIYKVGKHESTGYPTQKPLALLNRIILASSNPGDLVLDPFAGCATTCVSAQHLSRKWIGIDIEAQATKILMDRLTEASGEMFKDFVHRTDAPIRTDVVMEAPSLSIKERLYQAQAGRCNGCTTQFDIQHFEIDHIIPRAKGGGDYYENYQLLCGHCNRTKGDRPMEYLRQKIKAREAVLAQLSFGE